MWTKGGREIDKTEKNCVELNRVVEEVKEDIFTGLAECDHFSANSEL